ncbi:TolC family protein [Engelhardtia mirabilis]|uniref:Outer membrane efflux protein n=1 Tax=Engelhardtia mirabilis TaxID=2528011 RepID=A0A518BH98_9BACT|nr:Outer membrane efflux protein [Planctomycetes bacterium Pla133]QDV00684.1 Outer membrane efflux protein [Planctomycetes bacterium Pla86]
MVPVLLAAQVGCQVYSPEPLTRDAVDAALASPAYGELGAVWSARLHPLLPAVEIDLADGLDPTEAACLAVVLNPDLRIERARRGIATAATVQAGLLPNPQLGATFDRVSGGQTAGTVNAWGLAFGWDLGALIEHGAQLEAARASDRAAGLDLLWQEWRVACAARLASTTAYWQERICEVLAETVERQQRTRDALSDALESGDATRIEYEITLADLQSSQMQLRAARRMRDLAQIEVRRAIGLAPTSPLEPAAPPDPWRSALPSLDEAFAAARAARVDLAALRAGYEAQEERVKAAVRGQFPRLNVGLNTARDTGAVETVGVGVTIDLPIFDRAQGRIASERANRSALLAEYTAREFALRADLAAILSELERLGPEIEAQLSYWDDRSASLAELERLESNQMMDLFGVESMRMTTATAHLDLIRLQQRQAELRVGLEAVTGRFDGQELE